MNSRLFSKRQFLNWGALVFKDLLFEDGGLPEDLLPGIPGQMDLSIFVFKGMFQEYLLAG